MKWAIPVVPPEHLPGPVDNVAGLARFGAQPGDQRRVGPLRDKADVLAVGLVGDRQREVAGQRPGFLLGQGAQGEAQEIEFGLRRARQEIALVARHVAGPVQLGALGPRHPPRIVAGRQRAGAKFARGCEEVAELDALVAADARNRGLATAIAVGEILDHRFAKPRLVIKHVMRDAEALGDARRVAHILPGAARALFAARRTVVIELQRDADDLEPGAREQGRGHRRIDPARHRDDDAVVARGAGEIDISERHQGPH